jgi:hypothetical protein
VISGAGKMLHVLTFLLHPSSFLLQSSLLFNNMWASYVSATPLGMAVPAMTVTGGTPVPRRVAWPTCADPSASWPTRTTVRPRIFVAYQSCSLFLITLRQTPFSFIFINIMETMV